MIEIYIENKKIDIIDDLDINFTYETIDPNKLSSIKNSFSKTINIPGTSNNNEIFGNIFRIDRYIPSRTVSQASSNFDNIGFQFDPHKKAEFIILSGGSLINSGYCVLNNIIVRNEVEVIYQLVLYGGIGNFFYNLTYRTSDNSINEENIGEIINLSDLYWNWRPKLGLIGNSEPMTKSEENEKTIMRANTSIIAQSYHNLKPIEDIFNGDEETYGDRENYWNSDYNLPYPITDIQKDIVFVPCYTGKYENFDSNKMIVSTFNQDYETNNTYNNDKLQKLREAFPNTETFIDGEETKTYTTINKLLESSGGYRYGIATFSRDLDPWEAGDIRVNEMPVAIRLSKLMRTISMPWNNGGYTVDWDKDITDSPYWNYSWITLGKMNKEEEGFNPNQVSIENKPSMISYRYNIGYDYQPVTHLNSYYDSINPSNYSYMTFNGLLEKGNYNIKLRYNPKYDLQFNGKSKDLETPGYYITGGYKSDNTTYMQFDVILNEIRVETSPDFWERKDFYFDIYFYTELPNTFGFGFGGPVDEMLKQIRCELLNKININSSDFPESDISKRIRVHNISGERGELGKINFQGDTENYNGFEIVCPQQTISIKLNLEEDKNVQINSIQFSMFLVYSPNSEYPMSVGMIVLQNLVSPMSPNYYTNTSLSPSRISNSDLPYLPTGNFVILENRSSGSVRVHSFMAAGDIGAIAQNHHFDLNGDNSSIYIIDTNTGSTILELTKETLFAESKSPAKYLIDFCKIMNYRFICDETRKKIYIKTLKNYYKGLNIKEIDNLIDYSRDINIKNITTDNKLIEFGLDNLDTYPIELTERISKEKFNKKRYNTKVEWNQNTTKLLNDLIYKNTIEWQQSSVFYNLNPQMPKAYNTPTISWTLFNLDGSELNKKEFFEPGLSVSGTGLIKSKDQMPKLGFFNKENRFVNTDTNLIFLNGFVKNYDYSYTKQSGGEKTLLEPDEIITNTYVNRNTGQTSTTSDQDVYVYRNIDRIRYNYYVTAEYESTWTNSCANYYDSSLAQFLDSELSQSNGPYTQQILTIPDYTNTIMINVKKTDTSYKLEIEELTNNYIISPRNQLSEDTIEQYLFNENRCYTYDFKYNDNFNSWGSWSSDQKGCACPWVLPFFTRDLYNKFELYDENIEYDVIKLIPTNKYPNTKFLNDGSILNNQNWSQFEFLVPNPEPGWEIDALLFTASYPENESGYAICTMNNNNEVLSYQGIFSPEGQHNFVDSSINMDQGSSTSRVKKIMMNTYVSLGDDETYYIYIRYKKINYSYRWNYAGEILASWNLVMQNIANNYDISTSTFISNPEYSYEKFIDESDIQNINNNEYNILNWPEFSNYIFDTNWKDYMDDLYDRNTRDITLYIDLTSLGMPNDILRRIYSWKGFLWIIIRIDNKQIYQLGKDKFTRCTIHKIKNLNTWINN